MSMGTLRKLPGFKNPVLVDGRAGLAADVQGEQADVQGSEAEKANWNKTFNANRASDESHSPTQDTHTETGKHGVCVPLTDMDDHNSLERLERLVRPSKSAGQNAQGLETGAERLVHQGDPEPDPAGWLGEVELAAPPASDKPSWWHPKQLPVGSLPARLVAVGATINTAKGGSVRAPAGIPADLLREVEARGWRIIPGGKPNPEAEHDSWLAGVPIADLEP